MSINDCIILVLCAFGRELPTFGCIALISMSHVLPAQSLKSILLLAFEAISSCVVIGPCSVVCFLLTE